MALQSGPGLPILDERPVIRAGLGHSSVHSSKQLLLAVLAKQEQLLEQLHTKHLASKGLLVEQEKLSEELKAQQSLLRESIAEAEITRNSMCNGRKFNKGIVVITSDHSEDEVETLDVETPTTRSNPLQRPPSILKRSPLSPRSSQTSEIPAPPPPLVQQAQLAIGDSTQEHLSRDTSSSAMVLPSANAIFAKGRSTLRAWIESTDMFDPDNDIDEALRPPRRTERRSSASSEQQARSQTEWSTLERLSMEAPEALEQHFKEKALATAASSPASKEKLRRISSGVSLPSDDGVEEVGSYEDAPATGYEKLSYGKYRKFSVIEQEQQRKLRMINHLRQQRKHRHERASRVAPRTLSQIALANMRACIHTAGFETFWGSVLFTNVVMIGVQVEYKAVHRTDQLPVVYDVIDNTYAGLFVVELAMRIFAAGIKGFFISKDWNWNLFDFVVVCLTVLETITALLVQGNSVQNVTVVRVVRIIRVARVLRVIRVMRFLRSLRILITAISGTVKNFVWTLLLLMIINYTFGVVFTQAGVDYEVQSGYDAYRDSGMDSKYKDLQTSVLTLFQASTGGLDWIDAIKPLQNLNSPLYVFFFLCFISFVYLAVLNVVTGLFCQSAIEMAQRDHADLVATLLQEKQRFVKSLCKLFKEWDTSKDGEITLSEFEEHLQDEKMVAFLQALEIDIEDSWTLFKLLDADRGGTVTVQEFVDGCLRLKGNAKSMQVHQMMYESRFAQERVTKCLMDNERVLLSIKNESLRMDKKLESSLGDIKAEVGQIKADLNKTSHPQQGGKKQQDSTSYSGLRALGLSESWGLRPVLPSGIEV